MRVLALDTTTPAGSLAIVDDARVILERIGDRDRSHAERLPSAVDDALVEAEIAITDIDVFAVVAGPGSFTGLRVGIAAIQGFATVLGRPVVAISALDVLGEVAAEGQPAGTLVAAWMDAHRREVFSCLYRVGSAGPRMQGRLDIIEEARVATPAETLARWQAEGRMPAIIAGDGASLYAQLIAATSSVRPDQPLAGIAGVMAVDLATRGLAVTPAAVQPIYVRRPDAEVARDARAAAARLSPS